MQPRSGLSSPVVVANQIDRTRDYSQWTVGHLLGMPAEELAAVDPVAINLIVAKGVPALADLDIRHYQNVVDAWVADFTQRCLPHWEPFFYEAPEQFKNDIRYFRLGMVCQYLDLEIGIEYNRDQREAQAVYYTNPSDLFLNGVIDTRTGTCGNMAALQVAFGWRLGWPVSLACVNSHFILRYDDGETIYNIEPTQSGRGGFKSDPDEYLIETKQLSSVAIESGSDLRALRPHEMLGAFVGLRARHLQDLGLRAGSKAKLLALEPDWLLARRLFPTSRLLYKNQMVVSSLRGDSLFAPYEPGHPNTYAAFLAEMRIGFPQPDFRASQRVAHQASPAIIDELFFQLEINP